MTIRTVGTQRKPNHYWKSSNKTGAHESAIKQKRVEMKITGQILKENRERKGVTLSEVSLSTKITIKTLAAIEDGDPINLPPKTFLRGFVRSYAIYLGANVDEILRTFHEEMGSTLSRPAAQGTVPSELNAVATEAAASAVDAPSTTVAPAPTSERRAPRQKDAEATLRDEPNFVTKGVIFGGIALLVLLIVFLKGKMDSYESERTPPHAPPIVAENKTPPADANAAAAGDVVESDETELEPNPDATDAGGGTPPVAAITAATMPVATPKPTPKPSPSPTATPVPTPKATPTPTATPKATPAPTATPGETAGPTPKPIGAAPAGKSHEILIEALDQVEIEVTADGENAKKFQLRGDQVQSIKIKRKATLKISDGGAVNIIVNGVDRGVPGDLGKPTRVELP